MASALPSANSCVDTTCDDQITVQVPGPAGADGADGAAGAAGGNAYTTLTAAFTVPAQSGTWNATVGSTAWMAYGQIIILGDLSGTQYATVQVTDIVDGTTVTLKNLQDGAGAYADNVAPATVLPVGTGVAAGGLQGQQGTGSGDMVSTNNLSDVASAATSRTNLGLGTIATQDANAVAITGGAVTGITDLALADGGTGASDAATARTNLGLGTIATQAANSVSISGGSITGITDLAVLDGGTGSSTAAGARTNLSVYSIAEIDAELNHVARGHVILLDKKATTTDAGTFTAGAWQTRTLNTEAYDDMGVCSLALDQFTLDAGEYYLTAFCPAHKVNRHQARLYNVTAASVVSNSYGTNADSVSTGDDITMSVIHVAFTVAAGGETFEIQHYCETTRNTDGFGSANSFGGDEVYTKVVITGEI